ncbi:unnamed protein product, partial [Amoebophrya sp. A120]
CHRDSNTAKSKYTGIEKIRRAIKALMRGPFGKRTNMGDLFDARVRLLEKMLNALENMPDNPFLQKAFMEYCMQEAKAGRSTHNLTMIDMLKERLPIQGGVDTRWCGDLYTALLLDQWKWRLLMYLYEVRPLVVNANAQAALHPDADDDGLESDEEDDAYFGSDPRELQRLIQTELKPGMTTCVIEMSEFGHSKCKMLMNLVKIGPGEPLPQDVAERMTDVLLHPFTTGSPAPTCELIQIKQAQAKYAIAKRALHCIQQASGRHGKVGILEGQKQLFQTIS